MRIINNAFTAIALGLAVFATNTQADCITEMQKANWRVAIQDCEKQAQDGNGDALYYMGVLSSVQFDESFIIDYKKSFEYFQKSAKTGFIPAYYALSDAYHHGVGTDENPKEAFYWAEKSAHAGDADGAVYLSYFYSSGYGTVASEELAKFWLMVARIKIDDFDQQTQSYFDNMIGVLTKEQRIKLFDEAASCINSRFTQCAGK